MIHERRQSLQGRPMGESRLDRIETRTLKAANEIGVGRHGAMVAVLPTAMEGNGPENRTAIDGNLMGGAFPSKLVAAVTLALARCDISHTKAAEQMGISAGTWSKQLTGTDNHHIQLDKLALLPEAFHLEFARLYGEAVGMAVAHRPIADLLVARVGQLLTECNALHAQLAAIAALGKTA